MSHERPGPGARRGVRLLPGVAEIATHAELKAAARDWQRFSSALQGDLDLRDYRQLPLEVDPPQHGAYRAILAPLFERPAIVALEPRVRAVAAELVANLQARGSVDAVHEMALPMMAASIGLCLGRPQDADELRSWGVDSCPTLPDGTRDGSMLAAYLERVFAEVTARSGADAFSRISAGTVDGRPLSRVEMLGMGNLILGGGRDTVVGLICGAIWYLAGHPAERARLAADPARIPLAIEELLRYLSPLARIERLATEGVEGSWGRAAAGEIVLLGFAGANHDPAAFDAPQEVRLERRPNPHVAFGNGPHTCIGVHLARLEATVFLEELLAGVPGWRLREGSHIAFEDVSGSRVPVRFEALPIEIDA